MTSSTELPEVLVHMTESGDKPDSAKESKTGRVRINDAKSKILGSTSSLIHLDSSESVNTRSKKNGKPSRRWLAMEIEKLFKANVELSNQLKQKQGREEELSVVRRRLESELAVLKASYNISETDSLRNKNKHLAQDVFMLKNLVVKLTKELGKSQEKVRVLKRSLDEKNDECITISEDSGLADVKGSKDELLEGEVGVFWPLVKAYEENLSEKKCLINQMRQEMDRITMKAKQVIEENQQLAKRLASNQAQGEVSYGEYLHQQKELSLVVEQNQLLTRQAKLNQSKLQELRSVFQTNITECSMARDTALEELHQTRTELFMLKGRFSLLQDEYRGAKDEAESKIPLSVHTASINECKRLLEELKARYDEERDSLVRKLATLEAGRPDIEVRLAALGSERDRLIGQLEALQLATKKLELKCADVEEKLVRAEKCKENLKTQLTSAVAFSGELIREQERLVKQLLEKAEEAKIGSGLSKRLHALKLQVKGVEMEAIEQMSLLDNNLRSQADYVGQIRENYTKELDKLREDIADKEAEIKKLSEENKKTQEELSVVWKAATASEA